MIVMLIKKYLPFIFVTVLLFTAGLAMKFTTVDVEAKAVLSGEVSWTINKGETVTEGTELIRIRTLTGEITAARAPRKGKVIEVMVQPGDEVKRGAVVAKMTE